MLNIYFALYKILDVEEDFMYYAEEKYYKYIIMQDANPNLNTQKLNSVTTLLEKLNGLNTFI